MYWQKTEKLLVLKTGTETSDHNTIETKPTNEWNTKKAKLVEVFKFKDLDAKQKI